MIGALLYPRCWLHGVPAVLKLAALSAATFAAFATNDWRRLTLMLAAVLLLYASAGLRGLARLAQLRGLVPLFVLIALVQYLAGSGALATATILRFVLMIAAADLVVMSTTMHETMDAIAPLLKPLEWFGLDSRRMALAVALVLRFVPLLIENWHRRAEAWRARTGRRASLRLVLPFVAESLRLADHVAEALDARSIKRGARR